jgi:predicted nucleic acid-binding protein
MKRPSVVIDSSVACAWHIPHEKHPVVDDILSEIENGRILGLAPKLWVFEIHNVLQKQMRKFRHADDRIDDALDALMDATIDLRSYLPPLTQSDRTQTVVASWVEIDIEEVKSVSSRVLVLVRKYPKISFYDAVYLDLAKQVEAELACLDGNLAKAAKEERVPLRIPDSVYDEWCRQKEAFEKRFHAEQGKWTA